MIFIPAYAKLNLALSVVGRLPDGRHDLRSVVVRLDWHDLVGIEVAGEGTEIRVIVSGPAAAEVPVEDNLVLRAARSVLPGRPEGGIRLWLEKRLPAAAGLGGGSADAAAVLRLLGGAAGSAWEPGMLRLADTLGSDVPACLAGGSLLVGGAGESLEPILHPPLDLAVAVAGHSSTAATFAALTPDEWRGPERPETLAVLLAEGRPLASELCGSDLEAAACRAHPDLAAGLLRLRGALPGTAWHLTGSGGAVFALAAGPSEAEAVAARARDLGFAARACRTVAA
ncbi:MAG: 4-(cytidine 5'-diphospho)-2-C-methyl-D-erythritol kinase [Candidatus Dormibacteria bacterium]|jgi:4-diphosphocytidyl-2-C-methyl-D-erythritol kinase